MVYRTVERFFSVLMIAVPVGVLALFSSMIWAYYASYADYDQVKACLENHQFQVMDGWQREDTFLEDFGWEFRTKEGKIVHINVYKNDHARRCHARAVGVQLLEEQYYSDGPYLSFDHPDLVNALDGKQLKNMDDMLANIDQLLDWVEENPTFKVDPVTVEKNKHRYLNLIVDSGE